MSYEEFIQNIINTRGRFACCDEYHERHHILPKCMGGTNEEENLIDLFARERFIAHKLLAIENPNNNSLVYAYGCMAWAINDNQERYEVAPEEYEEARIALSESMKGKPKSEKHRAKLSEIKKGKPLPSEVIKKAADARRGVPLTDEHKSNISKALTGRTFSDEHKDNISKSKTGKPQSEAQKTALASVCEANKGRKHSEKTKAKMSASQKNRIISEGSKRKMSESAKKRKPNRCIKIAQCDLASGEVIKEWESAAEAHRTTGIDNSSILKCAKGIKEHAGGFDWKFIKD
jgi:hypothetical protein